MMLTGPQVEELRDAICAAMTWDEFCAILYANWRSVDGLVTTSDTYPDAVLRIVNTANRDGWLPELQRALRKAQENTP